MPRIDVPDGNADPEVRVWALRPEMGMAAGALSHAIYEQSIVPVRERELARMRIAQINGCAICLTWRKTAGASRGDDRGRLRARRRVGDVRRLHRTRTPRDRVRRAVRARPRHARRRLLRAPACRVHRRRGARPHRVHRRLARARPHPARARHRRRLPNPGAHRRGSRRSFAARGRPCRATLRSRAATATIRAEFSQRLGDLGTERRLPRVGRAARRGCALALRPARQHRRPLPRCRRVRRPLDIEVTTLRAAKRAESLRVSMRPGRPARCSKPWCGRSATSTGSSTTSRTMPDVPDPETLPVARRTARPRRASSPSIRSGRTSRSGSRRGSTTSRSGRTAHPSDPVCGHWFKLRARRTFDDPWVDACRSLILLDTLGIWPAACNLHVRTARTWRRASTSRPAFHRCRARRAVALRRSRARTSAADGIVGGEGRGLGARRHPARGRHEPAAVPSRLRRRP